MDNEKGRQKTDSAMATRYFSSSTNLLRSLYLSVHLTGHQTGIKLSIKDRRHRGERSDIAENPVIREYI
ncbi:hypothetical protein WN55_01572 [Dufourea novaeangliae]|uniref:Uncharacterized protein n=1 Tax=Dufourea novaeangliae TaxID=178035 RepID=A0A154PGA1_DUFNO|nr:hypothetical protein WN55_01572 [Dufourea novaeangliae]